MRKALTITVLAGAMTFGFGTPANALEVIKPSAGASCVTVSESHVWVTPDGGVIIWGHDVTISPVRNCI